MFALATACDVFGVRLQGCDDEANKLVFLGWPGQNEPEEEALAAGLEPLGIRGAGLQVSTHNA